MLLYRGTPVPQMAPVSSEHECVFFSPDYDYAVEYAVGERSEGKSDYGFVQKYRLPKQRLLDIGARKAFDLVKELTGERPKKWSDPMMLSLFWDPGPEWIDRVAAAGYTGTSMGYNLCIFDVSKAKLVAQWKLWLEVEGDHGAVILRRQRID